MKKMRHKTTWVIALAVTFVIVILYNTNVNAAPNGATINYNDSSIANTTYPSNRTDAKGTINTLRLSGLQQNTHWKAYVGNVSGSLTLDDANAYTIYDWSTGALKGEVYASRWNSITWASIACVTPAILTTEQNALGISVSAADSIQSTFNWSGHRSFDTGVTALSGCNSTTTYMNDTKQAQSTTAPFQEALLTDTTAFIYAAIINASSDSYRNGSKVDFQMIVADNASAAGPALTYFFYVELI